MKQNKNILKDSVKAFNFERKMLRNRTSLFLCVSMAMLLHSLIGLSLLSQEEVGNRFLLPEDFKVYTGNQGVVNHPVQGLTEKTLTTRNLFQKTQGCYIACYARDAEKGIYSVGDGIFVMGQIRIKGQYNGRICKPSQFETKDISAEQKFKDICNKHIPVCVKNCWAGGDTGGWFGIQ